MANPQSNHLTCLVCQNELKRIYTSDPLNQLQPIVTPCGHIFHKKCLEAVVLRQSVGTVDPRLLDTHFEATCVLCKTKFSIDKSLKVNSNTPHRRLSDSEQSSQHHVSNDQLLQHAIQPGVDQPPQHIYVSTGSSITEVNGLRALVQQLEEEKQALETCLRQTDLERDVCTAKLQEFRFEIFETISKMDQFLEKIAIKASLASAASEVPRARSSVEQAQQLSGLTIQTGGCTIADTADEIVVGAVASAQLPSPAPSTLSMYSTVRGSRSVSRQGSTATTSCSYHTAATSSSTASSGNRSSSSTVSFPTTGPTLQNGLARNFTQSFPSLHEPRSNRRSRTVWQKFSNLMNPGKSR